MVRTIGRKKTNFMMNYEIIDSLEKFVPAGERSDFVNEAVAKEISLLKRRIASREMDKLREEMNIYATTEEIIRLKNYGRK